MKNIKLKPCSYCKGTNIKIETWSSGGRMYMIKCNNQDCPVPPEGYPIGRNPEEVKEEWNRRQSQQPLKINFYGGRMMSKLIKRQDAINAVAQNYRYESDRMTALQEIPVITEEEIRADAVVNYSVAVLAEIVESAKQEDAPIYEGDKEVDQWVRLSDVEDAINKHLN